MQDKDDVKQPKKRNLWEGAIVALVLTCSFFLTRWFLGREQIADAFRTFDLAKMFGTVFVFILSMFVVLVGLVSIVVVVGNILTLVRKPKEGDAWGRFLRETKLDRWRRFWSRDYKVWGTNALISLFGMGFFETAVKDLKHEFPDLFAIALFWTLAAYFFGYIQRGFDEGMQ